MRTLVPLLICACVFACIFIPQPLSAQEFEKQCATMEYLEKQKKADPTLEARMQLYEDLLQARIKARKSGIRSLNKKPTPPPPPTPISVTIPVVVHIIYNTTAQNIDDARVHEQIAVLNQDYAGENYHSMQAFPHALKADTYVRFCLAQQDPYGAATDGIERGYTSTTIFTANNDMKYTSRGGLDAWDPTRYFNIWVCDLQGYAGYAQFPAGGLTSSYGAVVDYMAFGTADTTMFSGGGTTTTHEIGHCFNLRHVWGDDNGACTGTDYCDDTPNQANYNVLYLSGAVTDACTTVSPGIMYTNFMDYSPDRIQANFTPDQVDRIQDCFATPTGPLVPLLSSNACSPPSGCPDPIGLQVASMTMTTANLEWSNMGASTEYNVRYKRTNSATWINTTANTNALTLTGLESNRTYEFQVQNVCSGATTSAFSASCDFKTPRTGSPKTGSFGDAALPSALAVHPNPVSGQMTIYYTLEEAGSATVRIVNALGVELLRHATPFRQEAGLYSLPFDASRCVPGVYFVVVSTNRTIETTKFIIQR